MAPRSVLLCAVLAVAAALAVAALAMGAGSGSSSPCFGAASRDTVRPCHDPSLSHVVVPTPDDALIEPNGECQVVHFEMPLVCAFGTPADKATQTFALVGDSHASHWRAGFEALAEAKGWQGLSITRSGCPFTAATTKLPSPRREQCIRWVRLVVDWLASHPEITTVFVSEHVGVSVVVPRGTSAGRAQAAGYAQAWQRLTTVRHIVVVRDVPKVTSRTDHCIRHAMRAHEDAGAACALPRRAVLRPDPAVRTALRLRSPRVQVLDLTPFMCSTRLCFPVVGGALVHKDIHHLTRTFATTLGPYVLRGVTKLMASW